MLKHEKTGITDENAVREQLSADGFGNIYVWDDGAGTFFDSHIHLYDEVRWVLKGKMVISDGEQEVVLQPGDKVLVPRNTRHSARTDAGVRYMCANVQQ